MSETNTVYRKRTGFAHLMAAGMYSFGGLLRLSKEAAFRHELVAGVILAGLYIFLDVPPGLGLAAAMAFLLLIATEAINTAIEEIIDRISPEISETGRHAKDLGSLAVFCMILANGGLLAYATVTNLMA